MRMWLGVEPEEMCRQHLLGEHKELHMIRGAIKKRKSLLGYGELIKISELRRRHMKISYEIKRRGYNHKSNLEKLHIQDCIFYNVDHFDFPTRELKDINRDELYNRCPKCRKNIQIKILNKF